MTYLVHTQKFERHPEVLKLIEKDRLKKEALARKAQILENKKQLRKKFLKKCERIGSNPDNYKILQFSSDLHIPFYDFSDVKKRGTLIDGKIFIKIKLVLSEVVKLAEYYNCKIETADMISLYTIHKYSRIYIAFDFLKCCELSVRSKLIKKKKEKKSA